MNPGTNARCAKTGLEAERIAKIRDAGRSREDYFAEIDARKTPRLEREKEKDFVADIYRRQGPALKVRAAIELDCMDSEKPEPVVSSRARGSRSSPARSYGDSYGTALLERDARIAEAEAVAAERRAAQLAERRRNTNR